MEGSNSRLADLLEVPLHLIGTRLHALGLGVLEERIQSLLAPVVHDQRGLRRGQSMRYPLAVRGGRNKIGKT